jgi:dTMP kinase
VTSVDAERLACGWPSSRGESVIGSRSGALFTVEGLWGAGKSTTARRLAALLEADGFSVALVHYGPQFGVVGSLSAWLTDEPLRRRSGTGGYDEPHHATVDVLLRLCREAYHHTRTYRAAMQTHDVVILDHGVYSKLAYCLAVLAGQYAHRPYSELLLQLCAVAEPWFLVPDQAFYLDVPWPLARERAILRGYGSGDLQSAERLLFLPAYDRAHRLVARAFPGRVTRVRPGQDDLDCVARHLRNLVLARLMPQPANGAS